MAIRRVMARQFAEPHGPLGRAAGALMARTNAQTTAKLIDRVALRGDETVLEIGYGPGIGIELLAQRVTTGHVSGIDPSPIMRDQATSRCRAYHEHVELRTGTVTQLPWAAATFDAALSANSAQLWDPLEQAIREIARVLKPSARLALALHQRAVKPDGTFVDQPFFDALDQALEAAGFEPIEREKLAVRGGYATFIDATAPRSA